MGANITKVCCSETHDPDYHPTLVNTNTIERYICNSGNNKVGKSEISISDNTKMKAKTSKPKKPTDLFEITLKKIEKDMNDEEKVNEKAVLEALEEGNKHSDFEDNYNMIDELEIKTSDGEYKGQVMNKMKHGIGTLYKNGKIIYKGEWKYDKFDGEGTYAIDDNLTYVGSFSNGEKHGKGIITSLNENYMFSGSYSNGLKHGYAEEKFPDGTNYVGEYQSGKKHGKGKFVMPNGTYYEGEFFDDKLEGKVNIFDIQGIFKWSENKIYTGQWKNNTLTGFGVYIEPGKIYKGYFYNDKKNGYGMYLYNNDTYLIGKWLEDKMEGLAIYYELNKSEEIYLYRRHRPKKVITESRELEEVRKSDDYQNLLIFLEEMNNFSYDF